MKRLPAVALRDGGLICGRRLFFLSVRVNSCALAIRRGYPEFVVESRVESGPQEASVAGDKSSQLPPLACEEIVNLYLKDVDRSLIRENLRLSYIERLQQLQRNVQAANKIRGAGIRSLKIER